MARYTRRTVAVIAVAAVGFAACGNGQSNSRHPNAPTRTAGDTPSAEHSAPTGTRLGVPVGWQRGPDGARAAAVSAVALTGEVAKAGFITRGDMVEVIATRDFAPELTIATDRQLADLAEALGEIEVLPPTIAWTEVPLTARIVDADVGPAATAVRVEVWSVVVIASPDVGVPRQAWRTVTLGMVWEDGDWRVDSWDATPGPTPALAAAAAISSGRQVADVADWPPAGGPEAPGDGGGG